MENWEEYWVDLKNGECVHTHEKLSCVMNNEMRIIKL